MSAGTLFQRVAPLLFVVLWSSGFVGAKFGLPYAEPLTFLSARYGLVVVLMLLVVAATRAPWPASPRAALHVGVSGLLVQALYLGGVFLALERGLPAGIVALVVGMQPLLTGASAGALLGERVSPRQWGGLALGFAGIALVVGSKAAIDGVSPAVLAHMLTPALAALLSITAGTLYQKRFCPSFDLRTGSVLQFLPSLVLTLLIARQTETMVIDWQGEFIFALLWLVLVLSIGAISLLNLLIRSGSAVNVASLFYLTPPTTALIAWAVFGETLSLLALAGMAVAVTGVWLARRG